MMDARSEKNLFQVHPALANIMRGASQAPQPFIVVCGLRTFIAEKAAVASGNSQTMHSRHLPNKDGFSCAVDLAALINDQVSFAAGREAEVFGQIWAQVKAEADLQKVPLEWGGAWTTLKDWGHVQLPWAQYP